MISEILEHNDTINILATHSGVGMATPMMDLCVKEIAGKWVLLEEAEPDEDSAPAWYNTDYMFKIEITERENN